MGCVRLLALTVVTSAVLLLAAHSTAAHGHSHGDHGHGHHHHGHSHGEDDNEVKMFHGASKWSAEANLPLQEEEHQGHAHSHDHGHAHSHDHGHAHSHDHGHTQKRRREERDTVTLWMQVWSWVRVGIMGCLIEMWPGWTAVFYPTTSLKFDFVNVCFRPFSFTVEEQICLPAG